MLPPFLIEDITMDRPLYTQRPMAGDRAIVVANDFIGQDWRAGTKVVVVWDPLLVMGISTMEDDVVPVLREVDADGLNVDPKDDESEHRLLNVFNKVGAWARWRAFEDGSILPAEIAALPKQKA